MAKEKTGELVEGEGCSDNMAQTMRMGNCLGLIGICVVSVIDCLSLIPRTFALNVFMVLFCVLSLAAEMRTTKCLAGFGYWIIKNFYFVNFYTGRGLFYVFIGSCNLDTDEGSLFRLICGAYLMGTGVITIACACGSQFPRYEDHNHAGSGPAKDSSKAAAAAADAQRRKDHPHGYHDAEAGYGHQGTNRGIPNVYQTYKGDDEYERDANEAKRDREVRSAGGIVDVYASRDSGYGGGAGGGIANPYDNYQSYHTPPGAAASSSVPAAAPAASSAVPSAYGQYAVDDDEPKRKKLDDDDEIERMYAGMRAAQ